MADKVKLASARSVKVSVKSKPPSTMPATTGGKTAQGIPKAPLAGAVNTTGSGRLKIQPKSSASNLLPSKIKSAAVVTGSQKPKVNAGSYQSRGPTRVRAVPLHATRPPKVINPKLIDLYDTYLTDVVERGLVEQTASLQLKYHTEREFGTVCTSLKRPEELALSYKNAVLTKLWEELNQLDIIKGAFDNFIDFSGEEALVNIQTLLKRKYEVIYVKGAPAQGPVFKDVEMKKIVDDVQNHLTRNFDKKKVKGFLHVFNEKLKNLNLIEDETKKTNEELDGDIVLELEMLSLEISDKQRVAFEKEQRRTLQPKEGKQEEKKATTEVLSNADRINLLKANGFNV